MTTEEKIAHLEATVAGMREQLLAKNHRFGELLARAFGAGPRDEHGRVVVAFVVALDERSTNVDADWTVGVPATMPAFRMAVEGRNGEQGLATLVDELEKGRAQ